MVVALTISMAISSLFYHSNKISTEEQLKIEKYRVNVLHKIIQENDSIYKVQKTKLITELENLKKENDKYKDGTTFIIETENGYFKYNYYFQEKGSNIKWQLDRIDKKIAQPNHSIIYNNIIDCLNCDSSIRLLMANLKNKLNEKSFLNIDELNLYSNDMTYYNIISDIAISKLNEDQFLFDSDKKFYVKLLFKIKLLILKEMKELYKHDNFTYYEFLPEYDPIKNNKETLNKLGNLLFTINSFCEKYKI